MPTEFYIIAGVCVAVMGLSAFYLGDDDKRTRAFARVGLVVGGAGLFTSSLYFTAIFAVVLMIMLPIALIAAWWNGLF